MAGDRNDRRPRGPGGSKRKYMQAFGGDKTVAMPYGKQGILVTILIPNISRAGREAVGIFTEAWEELTEQGVKQGPITAPILPKKEGETATDPEGEPQEADGGQGEQSTAKAPRTDTEKPAEAPGASNAPAQEPANPKQPDADEPEEEEGDGDALDFSKMISSEVKDLKDVKKQPFVVHDTGVKTCMFIGMPLATEDTPGPVEVVKHVLEKAKVTRVLRLRHCLRLIPCTHIVRSQAEDIDAAAKAAISSAIDCSATAATLSTAVLYEHRAAPKKLDRMDIINQTIAHVPRPPHSVKLRGADKTISVQVVRNACGVAVLEDYDNLKRYNIKTLCQDPEDAKEGDDGKKDKDKEDKKGESASGEKQGEGDSKGT